MRAALFTREFPPHIYGGAGVHVDYLSRELAREIEVEVHCWGPQHSDQGNLHVRGAEPWARDLQRHRRQIQRRSEAFSLNLTQVKALEDIDIVHTHTWYVSMAGFLAKKLYGMPFVLTTHSLEPLRAWKSEQLGSGYAMSSWMERTAILDADAIIAVSNGTKADILRAYPTCRRNLSMSSTTALISPNTRRPPRPTRSPTTESIRPYRMSCSSAASRARKASLISSTPSATFRPISSSCSAPAHRTRRKSLPSCRQKVSDARLHHPRIVWIEKMVTKQETIQLYSNCRVFCCPSVYEPFGIINLEAMACRAPVVASATGGIIEVVVDGETGYLVPFEQDQVTSFPVDPDQFARDLAAKLTTLLKDPAACKRMGEAGRRRVEQHFAWSSIADQTIALYRELIDRRK